MRSWAVRVDGVAAGWVAVAMWSLGMTVASDHQTLGGHVEEHTPGAKAPVPRGGRNAKAKPSLT